MCVKVQLNTQVRVEPTKVTQKDHDLVAEGRFRVTIVEDAN